MENKQIFGITILSREGEIKAAGDERWLFFVVVDDDDFVVGCRMIGVGEYPQSGFD